MAGLPSFGCSTNRKPMRFRPSMMKAAANARNSVSRVVLQNLRKNTPAVSEVVTMTPSRKPSIMGASITFPYKAVQQERHGGRGGGQPQHIQIGRRDEHHVD